jgi:hypothetical protein
MAMYIPALILNLTWWMESPSPISAWKAMTKTPQSDSLPCWGVLASPDRIRVHGDSSGHPNVAT